MSGRWSIGRALYLFCSSYSQYTAFTGSRWRHTPQRKSFIRLVCKACLLLDMLVECVWHYVKVKQKRGSALFHSARLSVVNKAVLECHTEQESYFWVRLWGRLDVLPNSLKMTDAAYGREINIEFSGNGSGGHFLQSACLLRVPSTFETSWHCVVTPCFVTCVMIMLFNQFLDMPHLSGGWIILAKEYCSPTGM